MHKRDFLRTLGGSTLGLLMGPDLVRRMEAVAPAALAADEPFWDAIRARYRLPTGFIQLESGYFSMQAQPVLEAFVGHARMLNAEASHFMRTVMTAKPLSTAACAIDHSLITPLASCASCKKIRTGVLAFVLAGIAKHESDGPTSKPSGHDVSAAASFGVAVSGLGPHATSPAARNPEITKPRVLIPYC